MLRHLRRIGFGRCHGGNALGHYQCGRCPVARRHARSLLRPLRWSTRSVCTVQSHSAYRCPRPAFISRTLDSASAVSNNGAIEGTKLRSLPNRSMNRLRPAPPGKRRRRPPPSSRRFSGRRTAPPPVATTTFSSPARGPQRFRLPIAKALFAVIAENFEDALAGLALDDFVSIENVPAECARDQRSRRTLAAP